MRLINFRGQKLQPYNAEQLCLNPHLGEFQSILQVLLLDRKREPKIHFEHQVSIWPWSMGICDSRVDLAFKGQQVYSGYKPVDTSEGERQCHAWHGFDTEDLQS